MSAADSQSDSHLTICRHMFPAKKLAFSLFRITPREDYAMMRNLTFSITGIKLSWDINVGRAAGGNSKVFSTNNVR